MATVAIACLDIQRLMLQLPRHLLGGVAPRVLGRCAERGDAEVILRAAGEPDDGEAVAIAQPRQVVAEKQPVSCRECSQNVRQRQRWQAVAEMLRRSVKLASHPHARIHAPRFSPLPRACRIW